MGCLWWLFKLMAGIFVAFTITAGVLGMGSYLASKPSPHDGLCVRLPVLCALARH
jgi:hypothetical protein